jgi:P27 family predicted phage terminase small subunit
MGLRGPKPTPTEKLRLRGSNRACSRKKEIEIPKGVPDMPKWLPNQARQDWFRVTKLLLDNKLMFMTDAEAIGQYCLQLMIFQRNLKKWARNGYSTVREGKNKNGNKYQQSSPYLLNNKKILETLMKMEARFGLDPSARVGRNKPEGYSDKTSNDEYFGWNTKSSDEK